jgi:hypothetical protein
MRSPHVLIGTKLKPIDRREPIMLSGIAMSFCQASRTASTIVLAEAETAKPFADIHGRAPHGFIG